MILDAITYYRQKHFGERDVNETTPIFLIPKDSNFFTEGDFDLNNADDTTTDFTDGDNEDFKLLNLS